jgi:hypothetical protein
MVVLPTVPIPSTAVCSGKAFMFVRFTVEEALPIL